MKVLQTQMMVQTMNYHFNYAEKKTFKEKVFCRFAKAECCYCRKPLTLEGATVEHIIPKSYGGTDGSKNTALACSFCNTARADSFDLEEIKKNRAALAKKRGENVRSFDPHWRIVKAFEHFKAGSL